MKTRSTPAPLSFKGQATKHATLKRSVVRHPYIQSSVEQKMNRAVLLIREGQFEKIFSAHGFDDADNTFALHSSLHDTYKKFLCDIV